MMRHHPGVKSENHKRCSNIEFPYNYVKVTEWPLIGKIAAHSAYDMFHGISAYFLVWFFPTSVFGVGISF